MSWVATAIVGGAAISGIASAYGANKAAGAQQDATAKASQIAQQQYETSRADLAPFRQVGIDASAELKDKLPFLTSPIIMDQNALEQTPGYQFTKTTGLKAVQNSAAARGLGTSGAALKGAATFATELADKTYQDQFNLENINRSNTFNRLKVLIDTGAGAAAGTGALGAKAADTSAGATIAGGNAAAAGNNALGAAVGGVGNAIAGYAAYKGLYGTGGVASGAPGYYGGNPASNPNLVPV